jgi:hypothetical protein
MSDIDLIERLQGLNPLPGDPEPPPIEPLLARLDQSARTFEQPVADARSRRARNPRIKIAAVCAAGAVLALVVFATVGSPGGRTPDVLADVYNALAPGSGVLHMVEVTENTVGGTTATTREQIWTAQGPRRLRTIITTSTGETLEDAFAASPLESLRWSASEPNVILRGTPAGAETYEATPVSILRGLYAKGELTLAGKTTLEGRAVWQLTVHPQYTPQELDGKPLPDPTVFVDASTFEPVELVTESVTHAEGRADGTPELEVSKTRYVTYEEAPKSTQSESFLQLAPHPGAVEKSEP